MKFAKLHLQSQSRSRPDLATGSEPPPRNRYCDPLRTLQPVISLVGFQQAARYASRYCRCYAGRIAGARLVRDTRYPRLEPPDGVLAAVAVAVGSWFSEKFSRTMAKLWAAGSGAVRCVKGWTLRDRTDTTQHSITAGDASASRVMVYLEQIAKPKDLAPPSGTNRSRTA